MFQFPARSNFKGEAKPMVPKKHTQQPPRSHQKPQSQKPAPPAAEEQVKQPDPASIPDAAGDSSEDSDLSNRDSEDPDQE
jgi:hypothetical protein